MLPRPAFISVVKAVRACGLEGHLAALVLRTSSAKVPGPLGESGWTVRVRDLLAADPIPARGMLRTQDVATLGARLALGGDAHRVAAYAALAARELAREALPPAVRIHDDERLLLGVAAGIGAAAPTLAQALVSVLRTREHSITYRALCLDLWAEGLALGAPRLTPPLATRALRLITGATDGRPDMADEDRVALYWLATRLLDAEWHPSDDDLRAIDSVIREGRRAALTVAAEALSPLDAALLLDALTWSPVASIARRTMVEYVLEVMDAFPASAGILAARGRGRAAFQISDEYDVQDLFHALVRASISDIVPEDTTPKLAGKWSRLDFTSKSARLGFEVKHVKSIKHAATVREEILLDEATYQEHPYVEQVIAFIYDPEHHISLAARPSFERDLSRAVAVDGRTVQYLVRVRG
jgi:hypothetical protein